MASKHVKALRELVGHLENTAKYGTSIPVARNVLITVEAAIKYIEDLEATLTRMGVRLDDQLP